VAPRSRGIDRIVRALGRGTIGAGVGGEDPERAVGNAALGSVKLATRLTVAAGPAPESDRAVAEIAERACDAVLAALKPGALARDVYGAWQAVVDDAGLSHYRRHHCGYIVGMAFPPSWTGGNSVTGLRHDSDMEIKTGMSFHIMSWLMGCGRGDFFVSNCVLLTEVGPEALTTTPHLAQV